MCVCESAVSFLSRSVHSLLCMCIQVAEMGGRLAWHSDILKGVGRGARSTAMNAEPYSPFCARVRADPYKDLVTKELGVMAPRVQNGKFRDWVPHLRGII